MFRHRPVMHADCPEISQGTDERHKHCREAGRCVCQPHTKDLQRIRNQYYACLKRLCKPKTSQRDKLGQHALVACLRGVRAVADDSPWGQAISEMMGPSAVGMDECHWWHIASHSFSPYRSCMRKLTFMRDTEVDGMLEIELEVVRWVPAPDRPELALSLQHYPLLTPGVALTPHKTSLDRNIISEVASECLFDWDAFASLNLSAAWSVTWWEIDASERMVPIFRPSSLVVKALPCKAPEGGESFWQPRRDFARGDGADGEDDAGSAVRSASEEEDGRWSEAASDDEPDEEVEVDLGSEAGFVFALLCWAFRGVGGSTIDNG